MSTSRWFRNLDAYLFLVPVVVILLGLLVFPLFYTIQTSFSSFDTRTFSTDSYVGFRNYVRVLNDANFWASLRVTAIYLVGALSLQMVLGVAIAFLVAVDWPGSKIVRASLLIPLVVAPVVAGSVWKTLLDPLWGYVNYLITSVGGQAVMWLSDANLAMVSIIVIDTWRWTPFIILIVLAGIMSLDLETLEAARIDGANWWQSFWHVQLPLLGPVILAAFVVRWLGAIKMFDIIFASTRGGPGSATEVVNLFIYETAFRSLAFDRSAAMAILTVIGALVLTFVFVRITNALERRL